jgi:ribonuclease P protein component
VSLKRQNRLKQGRDFKRVRDGGERLVQGCLIANWLQRPDPAGECAASARGLRLGVVTSSKLGGAVVRNRARRLLREAVRLHQNALAVPLDLVLVARASIVGKPLSVVEKDFLTMLRKARLLKEPAGMG